MLLFNILQTTNINEIALKIAAMSKEGKESRTVVITQGDKPTVVAKGMEYYTHTSFLWGKYSRMILQRFYGFPKM